MIAMRDSIKLATDIYRPAEVEQYPAILIRTPYGKDFNLGALWENLIDILIDISGYAVVIQDTRGRFNSEGVDSLYFSDAWGKKQDGYDTVEWIASQSWSNGKVGFAGASATALTGYFMTGAAPPHLKCGIAAVAAGNLYEDAIFYHGVYRTELVDGWLQGNNAENFMDFFADHALYDNNIYDIVNLDKRWDYVQIPILHISGWHDVFLKGQINTFNGLQTLGGDSARGKQQIIIGPWVHDITNLRTGELKFSDASILQFLTRVLGWFDYYLKGNANSKPSADPVQYYLMGNPEDPKAPGNYWLSNQEWPPEHIELPVYLQEHSGLDFRSPETQNGESQYTYDPLDPVPTLGGRNLNIKAGTYDQSAIEARTDVLSFTSEELYDSLIITGPVHVTLYASTNVPDTDFTAKLCDVFPDGRSMLIADGIARARFRESVVEENFINQNSIYEYTIDLWSTAYAFAPEHQIRLSVSSSNYPRFDVNENTGNGFRDTSTTAIAHQTIYHNAIYPSALNLPVIGKLPTVQVEPYYKKENLCLIKNYPNPFNAETTIQIKLDNDIKDNIQITLYNALGQQITRWDHKATGQTSLTLHWQAVDTRGNACPSGIYFIQVTGGLYAYTHKLILLQ